MMELVLWARGGGELDDRQHGVLLLDDVTIASRRLATGRRVQILTGNQQGGFHAEDTASQAGWDWEAGFGVGSTLFMLY